jgi:hypothetical protein
VKGRYPRTWAPLGSSPRAGLHDGFAALEAELRCETCGQKHRLIIFHDATPYPAYGEVSFEESVAR